MQRVNNKILPVGWCRTVVGGADLTLLEFAIALLSVPDGAGRTGGNDAVWSSGYDSSYFDNARTSAFARPNGRFTARGFSIRLNSEIHI
jgi:hypothetical protein